jgi:hypothetical protein
MLFAIATGTAFAHRRPEMPYNSHAMFPAPVDTSFDPGYYVDDARWVPLPVPSDRHFFLCYQDSMGTFYCSDAVLPEGSVILIPVPQTGD